MDRTLLVLGGTSDIGFAVARAYAERGWNIILAVRTGAEAERNAADIRTRYKSNVSTAVFDACATDRHEAFLDGLGRLPDTVVSVVGVLGDQIRAQTDVAHATKIIRANFEGPALLLGAIANRMEKRGYGAIVGVSSVAGDRGRGSNYVYGSAKAGFTAFLSGLRNRLSGKGVRVLTVKPGFVRTRMTAGLALPGPVTAQPREIGDAIYAAAEISKRDVIYVRRIWRTIMAVITMIPEGQFKRLRL